MMLMILVLLVASFEDSIDPTPQELLQLSTSAAVC
jgi:hypothetical protein